MDPSNPARPYNPTEHTLRLKGVVYNYGSYSFQADIDGDGVCEVSLGGGPEGAKRAAAHAGLPLEEVEAFLNFAYAYECD